MTRGRTVTTKRLITALGLGVLLLGAVILWATLQGARPGFQREAPGERVLRQAREQLGPGAQVRMIEPGRGRIVCGYVGAEPGGPSFGFVSRPNRLLLSNDPLGTEFRDLIASACPDFPAAPNVTRV